jgi:hypothetical protein
MKQGTGGKSHAPKERFVANKISPGKVSQMGVHEKTTGAPKVVTGRKVEAPRAKSSQHHTGTQGRH